LGDTVEEGGLTRAIGADHRMDCIFDDTDVERRERLQTAETFMNPFGN
jgi:hypothetical protein